MSEDSPEPNRLGAMLLVHALQEQARVALLEHRLPSELRDAFERAAGDLLPAMAVLSHFLDRAENSEDAYRALWRLLSCTVTLIDPEANKVGIAGALKSDMGGRGGRSSAIISRAAAWRRWKKQAARIAVDVWRADPRKPDTEVAKVVARRFVSGRANPNDHSAVQQRLPSDILEFLAALRRWVNPRRK